MARGHSPASSEMKKQDHLSVSVRSCRGYLCRGKSRDVYELEFLAINRHRRRCVLHSSLFAFMDGKIQALDNQGFIGILINLAILTVLLIFGRPS